MDKLNGYDSITNLSKGRSGYLGKFFLDSREYNQDISNYRNNHFNPQNSNSSLLQGKLEGLLDLEPAR